ELVLDVGARGAGGALGAHGELVPVALEGVHLLFDDVRRLAHLAAEERRVLDDGRAHLGEAMELGVVAEPGLEALPAHHLVGKDIVHPPDRAKFHAGAAYGRCGRAGQAPRTRAALAGSPRSFHAGARAPVDDGARPALPAPGRRPGFRA